MAIDPQKYKGYVKANTSEMLKMLMSLVFSQKVADNTVCC